MSIILGLNCKMYRGTAGTPADTLMKNVKDVSCSLETGEADITTRAAEGWRVTTATLKEASIEWGMLYDPEDSDCKAVSEAFLNNTPISLYVGDGSGSGLDCDASITQFNIEQNLEEAVNVSVTAKPTNIGGTSGRAPKWITSGPDKTSN